MNCVGYSHVVLILVKMIIISIKWALDTIPRIFLYIKRSSIGLLNPATYNTVWNNLRKYWFTDVIWGAISLEEAEKGERHPIFFSLRDDTHTCIYIDFHIDEAGWSMNYPSDLKVLRSENTYLDQFVSPHNKEFRSKY